VDIVTTHLNSRRSTGVSDARSLYAYRRQAALLSAFLNEQRDPAHPLIVAGDFNTGSARLRRAALRAQIATWPGADPFQNALEQVAGPRMAAGMPLPRDVGAALRRATDWQFFASGTNARLRVVAVSVPFGREATGGMLSDHIGYTSTFRLDRRAR
jgi:endonuclease/exonuclease/phosphatase family metal-dependent hydrolase